jgi:AraC-like DNA-binding protein
MKCSPTELGLADVAPNPKDRGVLDPRGGALHFRLSRLPPSDDLAFFIEHYWIVRWDLRGRDPYPQETLPFPSVHVVLGTARPGVHGVITRRFRVLLEDDGYVIGTKFRPGAFHPFVNRPISELTDRSSSLRATFGHEGGVLERSVHASSDDRTQVDLIEAFFRSRLPARDEGVATVAKIVSTAQEDRTIASVEELAERAAIAPRTMQRMFRRYVGVSPKWVLRRFRIHEAAERAASGTVIDWAAVASDLGYWDQAHFIKDFKAQVGQSPVAYAARCAENGRASMTRSSPSYRTIAAVRVLEKVSSR